MPSFMIILNSDLNESLILTEGYLRNHYPPPKLLEETEIPLPFTNSEAEKFALLSSAILGAAQSLHYFGSRPNDVLFGICVIVICRSTNLVA